MSLFLFIFVPLAWALTGKLLGLAWAAACFYCTAGRRHGRIVSRWAMPLLPLVYLVLVATAGAGNAGHGFTLLGSAVFFEWIVAVPLYAAVTLAVFAGAVYVVRDLTVGHVPSTT